MLLADTDLEDKYWADNYRRWHAAEEVLMSLDKEFVGSLSSKGWMQEYDAAAELYTRSLFESLDGLEFEFHPVVQGKTPDFLLRNLSEDVVADVTVLHGGAMSKSAEQQDDYLLLRRKVMDIDSSIFVVEVFSTEGNRSSYGQGGGQVAFKRIVRPVLEWVRKQEETYLKSPSALIWQRSSYPGSLCVMEHFTFKEFDIDLQFTVCLYLKAEETEEQRKIWQYMYDGDIGVASGFMDDTDNRLEEALKKKVSYLEGFSLSQQEKKLSPYIIIVFSSNSFSPDKEDIEKVLYGPSTGYSLNSGPRFDNLRQWELRAQKGLHSYSEGIFTNRRKDLLAVLVCKGHIAYPESCEMAMWANPYASYFSIPQSLFQLRTYTLDRQIVSTPPA